MMKQILLFSMAALFIGATVLPRKSDNGKVYYFCDSRALDQNNVTGKQVIQYTGIKTLINNRDSIWKKTYEWATLSHGNCENPSGCTSDLNSYDTYEQAEAELDDVIKNASDTAHFILRKRDF